MATPDVVNCNSCPQLYKSADTFTSEFAHRTASVSTIYLLTTSMSQTSQKDFKVAVIGGGVCGLACAIALQKAGISVDLFEAAVSLLQLDAMFPPV